MKPTKVPPLTCPQCNSPEVTPGFAKKRWRKGKTLAFVRDGRIFCYACKLVTDAKGKTKKHRFSPLETTKEFTCECCSDCERIECICDEEPESEEEGSDF